MAVDALDLPPGQSECDADGGENGKKLALSATESIRVMGMSFHQNSTTPISRALSTVTNHPKTEPTTKAERVAWYAYDVGNSQYGSVCLALLFPVVMLNYATEAAGSSTPSCAKVNLECTSPGSLTCDALDTCVCTNTTALAADYDLAEPCSQCVIGEGLLMWYPEEQAMGLLQADAATVTFLGREFPPIGFQQISFSISVALQAIAFVTLGPFGDFGSYRYYLLLGCGAAGALVSMAFVLVQDASLYWVTGILMIVSNVLYGISIVFYNAYLPVLVEADPTLNELRNRKDAESSEWIAYRDRLINSMSNIGFGAGYGSTVLVLVVSFVLISSGETSAYLQAIFLCSAMWLLSVVGMFFYLKVRPGPHLKACREMHADGGRNYQGCYAGLGWYSTFCIFREAKVYPQTIRFLILWFFYSDTYSTIASFGIVFARYQLCMPEALLAGVLLLVTFVAMLGSFVADKLMERYKIKAKTVLVFCLCTYCCISAWGMIGIFSKTLGMRSQIEVWFFCIAHGMVIGSIQSVSRTIFADLIPHGREGEFFGLFEISDKGSSWLGPAVIAAISTAMPDKIHYGFLYLCFMCIWPTLCVWKYVDVEQGARDVAKFDIKNEAMGVHNSNRGAFACIDAQNSKPGTTVDDTANSPQKLERV